MKILVGTLVVALAACSSKASPGGSGSSSAAASASSAAKSGRSTLEVIRMADDLDLFPEDTMTLPQGGSLLSESVPIGPQRKILPKDVAEQVCGAKIEGQPPIHCEKVGDDMTVNVPVGAARNFLRVVPMEGETIDAAIARSQSFMKTLQLPAGDRVLFGKVFEQDERTKKNLVVAFRTYVVSGDPIITEKDIQSAKADDAGTTAAVNLTLTPEASTRFETFTGDNIMRRLAFVVDGNVLSAPVVQTKIGGGHLAVALSAAEKSSDADKIEAIRLAKALSPN